MSLPPALLLLLAAILPTIAASPITPQTHLLYKRSSSPRNTGIGFAIALSVLLVASIMFYLGVQRGRTGTWFCWRAPTDPDMLKSRISSPIQTHSSALPELSPVQAQPRFAELPSPLEEKPRFLELSAATERAVFEMGQASPRRPPSVASWSLEDKTFYSSRKSSIATACRKSVASVKTSGKSVYSTRERPPQANSWFDRKSWCCRGAMEVEDEEKKIRGKDDAGIALPPAAVVVDRSELDRTQSIMDWSGMEWLTKVYTGHKSRRLSGLRSFYISGDEK
jgi:hypothetical protein